MAHIWGMEAQLLAATINEELAVTKLLAASEDPAPGLVVPLSKNDL
jgi:hypothetical protein